MDNSKSSENRTAAVHFFHGYFVLFIRLFFVGPFLGGGGTQCSLVKIPSRLRNGFWMSIVDSSQFSDILFMLLKAYAESKI